MPHSIRSKLSGLRYKGLITDKEYQRLCKALDTEKAIEDIRAEIEKSISENPKAKNAYTQGLNDGMCHALHIISKHIGGGK